MKSEKLKLVLAAAALACAVAFVVFMIVRMGKRDTSTAKPTPYDLVCTECGAEMTMKLKRWPPPPCPECGKNALQIAAICPRCKTVAPMKDSRAFWENPYGAMRTGKASPRCPKCKVYMRSKISWRLQQQELRRVGGAHKESRE